MKHQSNLGFLSVQRDFWDSPWQNRHAFLWELSNVHPVFFLAPPTYLVDIIERRKRSSLKNGLLSIKPDLFSYIPPRWLPYNHRFPNFDAIIKSIRDAMIRKARIKYGFEEPILLIWHPSYNKEIGKHNEKFVIYYKYDNYAGYYSDISAKKSNYASPEPEMLERADIIFVTSQGLYELHNDYQSKMHLLPNGVDYDFFSTIAFNNQPLPNDLRSIPSPRIGYIGVINEKVDFKLLIAICRSHRDWSVVLVGPEKTRLPEFKNNLAELQKEPNCYFLGQKNIQQVPHYIKGMDVCMMCYLVNDWTYYGYPLKMHEYLACGKPSIASDLPAIREFRNVVQIAEGPDEWIAAIQAALEGNGPGSKKERLDVAANNSWEVRVEHFLEIVNNVLEAKY